MTSELQKFEDQNFVNQHNFISKTKKPFYRYLTSVYKKTDFLLFFRTSFAIWLLMNLMVIAVPRYGAVLMTACGFLLLSTVTGYLGMLPENPLVIHLEGSMLEFHLGWCFWLVLIAGSTTSINYFFGLHKTLLGFYNSSFDFWTICTRMYWKNLNLLYIEANKTSK